MNSQFEISEEEMGTVELLSATEIHIESEESDEGTRGGVVQMLTRWLSTSKYQNEKTKQWFTVEITAEDEASEESFRDSMRIGAKIVETVDGESSVDNFSQPTEAGIGRGEDDGTTSSAIDVRIIPEDAETPYTLVFKIECSVADTSVDDTLDESIPVSRDPHRISEWSTNSHKYYYDTCKSISATVFLVDPVQTNLQEKAKAGMTLSKPGTKRQNVKEPTFLNFEQSSHFSYSNPFEIQDCSIWVKLTGNQEYRIHGWYITP